MAARHFAKPPCHAIIMAMCLLINSDAKFMLLSQVLQLENILEIQVVQL
jgi:hypothetical protein